MDFKVEVLIAYLIRRKHLDKQTLGTMFLFDDTEVVFACSTLEPPWRNNLSNISCIPAGDYIVEHRHSDKYRDHFWVREVEGRELILIHPGNYARDTKGCILVGSAFRDIDGDGTMDVVQSKMTMLQLRRKAPDAFTLRVIE